MWQYEAYYTLLTCGNSHTKEIVTIQSLLHINYTLMVPKTRYLLQYRAYTLLHLIVSHNQVYVTINSLLHIFYFWQVPIHKYWWQSRAYNTLLTCGRSPQLGICDNTELRSSYLNVKSYHNHPNYLHVAIPIPRFL